ncbi:hypothetical protein [Halarcobacter bivalviorum]|uniref:Membrane protein n=1 Tax=Halarcobacter bivalviorum TaxID=663364 RepID=A0AAX2A9S5_9BACT|nr:hypothetical protein [Halarcobacter bivalviorum]AXH11885.1 putative membrane protein [Halarcobacter bivalviorum]RXK11007.1 hypothetical protein CRV05_01160 [Halarcobacter bivalviorum]
MLEKIRRNYIFLYIMLSGFFYFLINFKYLFSLTDANDPLQYIIPSLYPENGFEFIDRILLWLWLRLISNLPIPLEYVSGIATLLVTTFTLMLSLWYLNKKVNIIASSIFLLLYVFSPAILEISSYTYPMQLFTLILLFVSICIDLLSNNKIKFFIIGFFLVFLLFTKIQAYSFVIFIAFYLYYISSKRDFFRNLRYLIFGSICAFLLILSIIIYLDGYIVLKNMILNYLNEMFQVQYKGRAAGGFPPFFLYLIEPSALLAFIGLLLGTIKKEFFKIKLISIIGLVQLVGLLFVYLVTSRGGTIIGNYIIDAYILGLISISAVFGILLCNLKKSFFLISIVSLVLTFGLLFFLSTSSENYQPGSNPIYIFKNSYYVIIGIICFVMSLLFLFFLKKDDSKVIPIIFILVLLVIFKSKSAVDSTKYFKNLGLIYHNTAKKISEINNLKGPLLILFYEEGKYINDSSKKLHSVYDTFYNRNNKIVLSNDIHSKFNTVITNNISLLNNDNIFNINNSYEDIKIRKYKGLFILNMKRKKIKKIF